MRVWSLGQEDPLEKEMAILSSILAWKIPWTGRGSLVGYSPRVAKSRTRLECYSHITQSLKERRRNLAIWNSMDGPRVFCAIWNKAVREIKIPMISIYIEYKKQSEWTNKTKQNRLMDTENKLVIARVKRVVERVSEICRKVWDVASCYKMRKAKCYNVQH